MRKTIITAAFLAATLGLAGTASAGEVTGNGKSTPVQSYTAGSICAFSGLNDDPTEPDADGRTQTWGGELQRNTGPEFTISEAARSGAIQAFGPGTSCRGFASGGGD